MMDANSRPDNFLDKGDTLKINGTVFQIPSSGIAGLGNPTTVFLNGVASQTLAINTTYFIYAFSNSGTVTVDFSTTGHSASVTAGNVGTEIKTGDDTRSLIGMVRTGGTVIRHRTFDCHHKKFIIAIREGMTPKLVRL